ncbi:glucoamylase [Salinibacter sp. 10B]|uniref:glycoside hydrolase family 15 protein n=1 Tax=Salinibacter sp. 10B TaxID=1923971 RepID=UPI000CF55983|nr:glycoside hydrolase family 15 protein [Salinibacter sp. 10B]PQJ35163.1 glucoamylase [Salinibacter sp. 10B]
MSVPPTSKLAIKTDYRPIEHYGLIGDMHTVALVSKGGSIDWCCLPRFDGPSVFARLLDAEKGGHFQIKPQTDTMTTKQFYWPETNVLVTRFLSGEGVGEVCDFMPVTGRANDPRHRQIIRTVRAVRGTVVFQIDCQPAFNYARDEHETELIREGACFRTSDHALNLAAAVNLQKHRDGVRGDVTLNEGESTTLVLRDIEPGGRCVRTLSPEEADQAFRDTVQYWRDWLSQSTYTGRWREMVHRSALTLKLLTYEPTGAIVAAPTCSLPEDIGGERNWDYRYTWIRDATFTLYAFLRIGFTEEARNFIDFLSQLYTEEAAGKGPLQVMYGIDGRTDLTEETLDHLEGYRNSAPVRIGNGAYDQLQLDIYGELIDAIYLHDKYGVPISYETWQSVRTFVNWVCDNWDQTDEGVWEVRGGQQHFLYSKLMCWVAVDRGLRLARKRSLPADEPRWRACRNEIYEAIMTRGWNEEREAFTQTFGGEALDASTLMMPLVRFISPGDDRLLKTLDATLASPDDGGLVSNGLVYRYDAHETNDGMDGAEGTFNICTFWLVEALTRASEADPSRLEDARLVFEQMLGYANHLGLYAEETGTHGEALGNFPQAFTHLALISAAYNLDRTLDGQ